MGILCDEKYEHYSTKVYYAERSMYLFSRAKVQAKGSLNRVLEVVSRTEAKLDRILSTGVPSLARCYKCQKWLL